MPSFVVPVVTCWGKSITTRLAVCIGAPWSTPVDDEDDKGREGWANDGGRKGEEELFERRRRA